MWSTLRLLLAQYYPLEIFRAQADVVSNEPFIFIWGNLSPDSMIEREIETFYCFSIHVVVRRNKNHEFFMELSYLG